MMAYESLAKSSLSEIERLNWTLAAIGKVSTVLVRAKTERELFVGACEAVTAGELFALAWIGIPLDDDKKTIDKYARAGRAAPYLDAIELTWGEGPLGSGPTAQAIKSGSLRFNNDLLNSVDFLPWRKHAVRWNLRSSFSLPIKLSDGRVVAALVVYSEVPGAFGEQELQLFTQLAGDIAYGVEALRTRAAYDRAKEETAKQDQQIRLMGSILESSPDAVVIADSLRRIVSINPSFTETTGYLPEDVIGRDCSMDSMYSIERHSAGFFEDMAAGIANNGSWRGEVWHKNKAGSEFLALLRIIVVHGTTGDIIHYVGIFSNISDRRDAEHRVGREKMFSDAMMESMPGITYFYTRDGKFLRWNNNFMAVSGYTAAEIAHMHPLDFFSKAEQAFLRERIAEVFDKGESSVEANLIAKDGTAIPYLFTGKRVLLDDAAYLVGVGIDIAKRKQAEQELQEYAMRLRAMSRQLLSVQENERRLLARELHDTVGQELAALSLNLSIIGAVLNIDPTGAVGIRFEDSQTLLEDATQHLRDVMVELRPPGLDEFGLVAALREHAQQVARRGGLGLIFEGTEPEPRLDPTEQIALFRIVQEALNNIVKHARAKSMTINLKEDQGRLILAVTDDGSGFDTAQRSGEGGHGMGMTTMRERAEAIGADLRVRSGQGEGTSIIVTIPRRSA